MARDETELSWREKALKAIGILEKVSSPPLQVGTVLHVSDDTVDISTENGSKYVVNFNPELKKDLKAGQRVHLVPDTMAVISIADNHDGRNAILVKDILPDGRIRADVQGNDRVIYCGLEKVKVGDTLLADSSYSVAVENIGNNSKANRIEKVAATPWSSIGGLEKTIEDIKDAVETPFTHKKLYARFPGKRPPKGILLYGPPGCGKTLLGRAIAFNLAERLSEQNGKKFEGHFLYAAGPEFLQKYVGTGEAKIRELFSSANEVASQNGEPVVVFIDEPEASFRRRGSGISTDATDSLVNQVLVEMDGLKPSQNIIVVYASNRQDILDPAILRPGRIDRKIYVPRPNKVGAEQIFKIYLKDQPLHATNGFLGKTKKAEELVNHFATYTTGEVFDSNLPILTVTYRNGEKDNLHYRNIFSGASAVSIVGRASDKAFKRGIKGKNSDITKEDLSGAVREEYEENRGITGLVTQDDIRQFTGPRFGEISDIRPYESCNGTVGSV